MAWGGLLTLVLTLFLGLDTPTLGGTVGLAPGTTPGLVLLGAVDMTSEVLIDTCWVGFLRLTTTLSLVLLRSTGTPPGDLCGTAAVSKKVSLYQFLHCGSFFTLD